jgi:hypothetical protein
MITRGQARSCSAFHLLLLAALMPSGLACVGVGNGDGSIHGGETRMVEQQIRLPDAEQMIDDLDRMLTANGTIGVKSPDVWGQDRLAKFRSEYETQLSEWLKTGYKGDINASIRRSETEAHSLYVGTTPNNSSVHETTTGNQTSAANSSSKSTASPSASMPAPGSSPDRTTVALEPTVVLDEHSNYLNHLNQLRRINAGDDLTDRPGYGLYLVRIPVTLSPGPRSRRGTGAIITVSAKSLMTKDTLRNTLRNTVINETVNNLTQAIGNPPIKDGEPTSGPGAGSFSLVSYADTEVFYGPRSITLLKNEAERLLARDLADEPHHRSARVADWLRGELEASYQLLEEAATPVRGGQRVAMFDPLEEVGDLVMHRDYTKLAHLQLASTQDQQVLRADGRAAGRVEDDDPGAHRRRTSNFLGYALRIQAAAVNRRLKQDMTDQDPSLKPESLKNISFFEPHASEEAMRLFERYVDEKWPLRVYAIEPVIAQQNVADGFGRRTQSAFDLAAVAPVGPLKALSGLTPLGLASERRGAEDENAIRLNPTMVGFGAGERSFGWIFYPRIQTRMRDGHLITDIQLLLNGRFPDPTGKEQSIEPGQRECTALIVMPNFIPRIEFITVADWFRTSEVGDGQKSDLEKASTLSRKLVAAESALNRAKIEGQWQYRPEEYQIAVERLNQLKSLMPTQRLVVQVPFTDNNNDSRIFCSQGGQLRPTLLAWHGPPPLQGEESTILIEGKNFSVHDTHVIAGGKPAKQVLVSRNILEVTISKEACPSPGADGKPLLDISVATPNGVSNHLLMKMRPPRPDHKPSEEDPSETKEQKPPPKDRVGLAKTHETAHHVGKDQDKAVK